MIKKITVFASVLAFASVSSAALACGGSCKDRSGKEDTKTELISTGSFDTACTSKDSCCGSGKGNKKA
ncbi:MAG TPA: hypothetical protein VK041_07015 [Opitutales bacterium]|nr:hypothetical protein [Opitutales bacterium]